MMTGLKLDNSRRARTLFESSGMPQVHPDIQALAYAAVT